MTTKTFKGLPVLRKTTADKVKLPPILIHQDMEPYSGWGWLEHRKWVADLTGLGNDVILLPESYVLATDECCSEVWLLSRNHYKTTARLIYQDPIDG